MKIFVLAENYEKLARIQDRPFFDKINLAELDVGEYQLDALAENRIFLSKNVLCNTDWIGFASSSWNEKYYSRLEDQGFPRLSHEVAAADLTPGRDWARKSDDLHPGMGKLLSELAEFSGYQLEAGETFYSNNFICSKEIFDQFLPEWKRMFFHCYQKYKCNPPFTNAWPGYKPWLHPAYFYERITMLYFANRTDLNLIPAK